MKPIIVAFRELHRQFHDRAGWGISKYLNDKKYVEIKRKECLGALKSDCPGSCPDYQRCLEISMGCSMKDEVRG